MMTDFQHEEAVEGLFEKFGKPANYLDHRRYKHRQHRELPLLANEDGDPRVLSVMGAYCARDPGFDLIEHRQIIEEAFVRAKLSDEERLCFTLLVVTDIYEAAFVTQLGQKTVRRRAESARKKLAALRLSEEDALAGKINA